MTSTERSKVKIWPNFSLEITFWLVIQIWQVWCGQNWHSEATDPRVKIVAQPYISYQKLMEPTGSLNTPWSYIVLEYGNYWIVKNTCTFISILQRHNKEQHSTTQREKMCKDCGAKFVRNAQLKKHELDHLAKRHHACPICARDHNPPKCTVRSLLKSLCVGDVI